MASSQRNNNTELQYGEQDVIYESDDDENDEPLLPTNLSYTTPQNDPSSHSVDIPLSLSDSHSFCYSHARCDSNNSLSNINIVEPQYSVDSASNSDLPKLKRWLTTFKIEDIYPKLIEADYDSVDVFRECDDNDIISIARDYDLSTLQKLRLKQAVRSLQQQGEQQIVAHDINEREHDYDYDYEHIHRRKNSVIITEKEKLSMMGMEKCAENITKYICVIEQRSCDLEDEKKCKESEIMQEFSLMCKVLIERRTKLLNELHFIYSQKKDIFEQRLIELREMMQTISQSQKECSKLILSKSVRNYEDNISFIRYNDIEKEIKNICKSCVHKIDPININTNIKFDIKTKDIMQILNVMGDIHENRESYEELRCDEVEEFKENNRRKRSKAVVLVADEWSECGDNLLIAPEIHSGSNIITNIGKIRDNNRCYKGSGFGSKVVYRGIHFWKLQVLFSKSNNSRNALNNFAIGFVAERHGSNKRNSWFLTQDKSMGIYSDKQIWCNGKKISSNKGLVMGNKDMINIALDIDNSALYVQRIKYNENRCEYKVYKHKQIALKRNAIHLNEGYRLGCYLRQKGQSITIVEYDDKPFQEWF